MKMVSIQKDRKMVLSRQTLYRACVKTIHYQHLNVRDSDGQWGLNLDWSSYKRALEREWGGGGGGGVFNGEQQTQRTPERLR